jgi:hypothetical protein
MTKRTNNNYLYDSKLDRIGTILGDVWWASIAKCQEEYKETGGDPVDFQFWLTERYGIKIYYDVDIGILPNYDIVDEKKYLFFKMKYSAVK